MIDRTLLAFAQVDIPFLGTLASQGLLALLLSISLFANWFMFNRIQYLNDKRVEDAKEITTKIVEPLNAVKTNGELLISLFNNFLTNGRSTKK